MTTSTPTHIMSRLQINTDLVRKILVLFLRDAVTRIGYEHAILNLSGGINSALVAFLIAEAVGPENVLALRLPYHTSSPDSLADAQAVIDHLGFRRDSPHHAHGRSAHRAASRMSDIRKGNIMARQRMIVLYDQSAAWNVRWSSAPATRPRRCSATPRSTATAPPRSSPSTTCTRRSSDSFPPRSICRNRIQKKAPSANLWAGQTDEGELGFTYAEVDRMLYLLVDGRYSVDEVVERRVRAAARSSGCGGRCA